MSARIPKTVAPYYSKLKGVEKESALAMRESILSIIPNADEVMSYGMPAFSHQGTVVAGIMVHTKHLGYYPFSGSVLKNFPEITAKYATTKSAVHVPLGKAMLKKELRALIKARIALATK